MRSPEPEPARQERPLKLARSAGGWPRDFGLSLLPAGMAMAFVEVVGSLTWTQFATGVAAAAAAAGVVATARQRETLAVQRWLERTADDGSKGLPPVSDAAAERFLKPAMILVRQRDRARRRADGQERLLSDLTRELPDPVLMVNAAEEVVRANDAAWRAFRLEPAEGLPLGRIIRDASLLAALRAALETGQTGHTVFSPAGDRLKRFAALVVPTGFALGRADEAGRERGALIVLREETERVMIERVRSDFVANASHEIRTPLASLQGFIETLQGPAKDDAAAREAFLGTMAEETARMTRLVDDLLSLSRLEALGDLPQGRCRLDEVVDQALARLTPAAERAGVALVRRDLADEPLPVVPGDGDQLHQMVFNLVDNAIKYGASGGEVVIETDLWERAPADKGALAGRRAVTVAVVDRGPGVAREHLPRLTERFYRADKHRSRSLGGTGLGLAIVKHIVRAHRGHLTITSRVGQGSRFEVLLPVSR